MCAGRSVNSWDIILEHRNGQVFFDKRESGPLDYITVNENAADPPVDSDDASNINSAGSLSLEATYISHNFSSQVSANSKSKAYTPNPNPFYSPEVESEPPASTLTSTGSSTFPSMKKSSLMSFSEPRLTLILARRKSLSLSRLSMSTTLVSRVVPASPLIGGRISTLRRVLSLLAR